MKKIHILYISAFSQWGGSTISLLRLVEKIDQSRFRITIAVPVDGPMVERYEKHGSTVRIIPISILLRFSSLKKIISYLSGLIPSVLRLYRLIRKDNVDVVHSNDSIVLVGGMAARLAGVKSVSHIRDNLTSPASVIRLRNFLINLFSDRILPVSWSIRDNFIAYGGSKPKCRVFYNGVDPEIFSLTENGKVLRKEFSLPSNAKIVAHIARIDPNKGQECLIHAAPSVLKVIPSAYFLLVGDSNTPKFGWYKERVLQSINEEGLNDRIIFAGKRDNIQEIISLSDVVVLPSNYEALPNVICEASSCGKPVIASKVGGIPELIKDGDTGFLIPPQDTEALSRCIIKLLSSDRDFLEKMGLAGRKYMSEKFNINVLIRELEMIYKELLHV